MRNTDGNDKIDLRETTLTPQKRMTSMNELLPLVRNPSLRRLIKLNVVHFDISLVCTTWDLTCKQP